MSRSITVETAPAAIEVQALARRPRIRILDGLRLAAALLVVSWHYIAFGHGAALTPYAQVPLLYPVAAYGWLGVELFFLISGFVISMSSIGHTLSQFIQSRITRLYPAYWFAILLTTAVLFLWPIADSPLPLKDVATNLTMLQSGVGVPSVDAVYWTLWSELHFYVLFALVVWRGVTYGRTTLFLGVWLVATFLADNMTGRVPANVSVIAMPAYSPFFIAGVAFFLIHRYGQRLVLWAIIVASFLMGIHPVLRTLDGSNSHLHQQISQWPAVVLVGVFFVLMAAVALRRLQANWQWLGVAGAMTYPLYLIHEYIGWAILKTLNDRVPGPVLYVGTLALMLLVAWLVHRFVEKPVAAKLRALVQAAFEALSRVRTALVGPALDDADQPEQTPVMVMEPVAVSATSDVATEAPAPATEKATPPTPATRVSPPAPRTRPTQPKPASRPAPASPTSRPAAASPASRPATGHARPATTRRS